jgi:hypothetical protein
VNADFPKLEGFRTVDSLRITPGSLKNINIKGISKVNKGVYLQATSSGRPVTFGMPDIEEIGGDANITLSTMTAMDTLTKIISFDKLKRVGGNFVLSILTNTVRTLSFPKLETVNGNFNLSAGNDYSTTNRGFETLDFPSLTTINGKLTVHSGNASRNNTRLTNLNGFAALRNVKAIDISRQTALKSYEGLQNAFNSLGSSDNWTVSGNGYNPSYQDLKDGKWNN